MEDDLGRISDGTLPISARLGGVWAWGEVFGNEVVAAAMIDRLVHHPKVVSLRG
jgi:IstB-like ATP binding protein